MWPGFLGPPLPNALPLTHSLTSFQMADERKPKQKTSKGLEIPVPTKGDFDAAIAKVAPPAGRKRPDDSGQPRKQSE